MKKIIIVSALFIALASCGGSDTTNTNADSSTTTNNDDPGLTNPSAIDTTKHPDGIVNGSVISTDTAAMNVQNSINKANAAKKNKK
ncbi:hypothetical protein [Segetibacter aerophilus]|uniref:Lipoprotein n=1 Tax=Segetibacter aerophilus TaxID=670293 RepID=A0A512BJQ6_9BACT|nr:hypothetical protein [Segetibacter aerophilus]GEO12196.1 hypothetical protein SAE01_46920 [Segetibacter aerophilus]